MKEWLDVKPIYKDLEVCLWFVCQGESSRLLWWGQELEFTEETFIFMIRNVAMCANKTLTVIGAHYVSLTKIEMKYWRSLEGYIL